MSRVVKVVSLLFLLVFGLGLTACAPTIRGDLKQAETPAPVQKPSTKEDLAKQQQESEQKVGDESFFSFSKSFPDGRILHCVSNYRTLSCIPK